MATATTVPLRIRGATPAVPLVVPFNCFLFAVVLSGSLVAADMRIVLGIDPNGLDTNPIIEAVGFQSIGVTIQDLKIPLKSGTKLYISDQYGSSQLVSATLYIVPS